MFDTFVSNGAVYFTVAALLGTGVFLIKLLAMMIGVGDDDALGAHAGVDGSMHHDGMAGVLSVQGAAAFAMGFGWAGLLARTGFNMGATASILLGLAGGILMCFLLATLISGVRGMQSSGTFQISQAVGLEGEVYAGIPAAGKGRGQIRVVAAGRQRIVQALAAEGQGAMETGMRVRVVRAGTDNTVYVEKV